MGKDVYYSIIYDSKKLETVYMSNKERAKKTTKNVMVKMEQYLVWIFTWMYTWIYINIYIPCK